jgi:hypothetical protein
MYVKVRFTTMNEEICDSDNLMETGGYSKRITHVTGQAHTVLDNDKVELGAMRGYRIPFLSISKLRDACEPSTELIGMCDAFEGVIEDEKKDEEGFHSNLQTILFIESLYVDEKHRNCHVDKFMIESFVSEFSRGRTLVFAMSVPQEGKKDSTRRKEALSKYWGKLGFRYLIQSDKVQHDHGIYRVLNTHDISNIHLIRKNW